MKILITGKKIELTDGIKGAVEDKLGKLEKYLHEDTEVKVTVSARKAKQKIEVTIIGTIVTPIILHNVTAFNFEILPPLYYLIVLVLVMAYAILVQVVKKWYIKKYGDWL